MFWSRFIYIILIGVLLSQDQNSELPPDKGVEFRLNSLSGIVFDYATKKPVEDVVVELYTGNKVLKHSLLTNEVGLFSRQNIGYLWNPKLNIYYIAAKETMNAGMLPKILAYAGSVSIERTWRSGPTQPRLLDTCQCRDGTAKLNTKGPCRNGPARAQNRQGFVRER